MSKKRSVRKQSRFVDPASAVTVYDSVESYLASFDAKPPVAKLAGSAEPVKESSTSIDPAMPLLFNDIVKSAPTPSDAHVPNAGGKRGKKGKSHACTGADCAYCASEGKMLTKRRVAKGHKETVAAGLADLSARADATSESAHAASTSMAHEEAESLHRRAAYAHEEFGSDKQALRHRRHAEKHSKLGRELRMVSKGNPNHDKRTGQFAPGKSGKGSYASTPEARHEIANGSIHTSRSALHAMLTQHVRAGKLKQHEANDIFDRHDVLQRELLLRQRQQRELPGLFARVQRDREQGKRGQRITEIRGQLTGKLSKETLRHLELAKPHAMRMGSDRVEELRHMENALAAHMAGKKKRSRTKKSADTFSAALPFRITKLDEEKRMVYGFASVTSMNGAELTDGQNDVLDMVELTKAAHNFMRHSRTGGEMHQTIGTGEVVESLLIDADVKKELGITRPEEGWFIGYHVTSDAVWNDVKGGRYAAFSIGGTGKRVPVLTDTDSE